MIELRVLEILTERQLTKYQQNGKQRNNFNSF